MKKKLVVGLLTISMVLASMAGCSKKESQTSKNTSTEETKNETTTPAESENKEEQSKYQTTYGSKKFDNVKITVELFDRSNAPDGSTITENKWVDYVNEQMNKVGITVEFVPVPRGDEVTKMQAMMASQTAPDITITYTYAHAENYYNQGGTWNLSEFVDGSDQAQNLKKYLGNDVIDIARSNDALYGIVAKRATTAASNLFIRKDWLDALGLAVPTTPDELHNVLTQFVKNNPDGRSDAIGANFYNAWNTRLAFSQVAGDEKKWYIAEGDNAFQDYYDPGMKEYFRYKNQLYNEGLIGPEYYAWSEDDFKSYIVTGALGYFEYNVNGSVDVLRGSLLKTLQENNPKADIISIPNLLNVNDGKQYSEGYASGGLVCFCPKTASEEVVEACMTYLDWQATQEGGFAIYHGFAGEHYDDVDGVPVVKDAAYNSKDKDWIRTDLFLIGNQGYFSTVDDFNACTSKEAPGFEDKVIANYENALAGTVRHMTTYTSPSTSDLITDIDIIKDQYDTDCVTCSEADFETTWASYMSELEAAGIQKIIDERTAYYDEVYGK